MSQSVDEQQQQQQHQDDVRSSDEEKGSSSLLLHNSIATSGDNYNNNNNDSTSPSKSSKLIVLSPSVVSVLSKLPGGSTLLENNTVQSIVVTIQQTIVQKLDVTSTTFKLVLLLLMVFQNSFTVLVARYTQATTPKPDLYDVNHLIMITELTKFIVSCSIEYYVTNYQLYASVYYYCYQQRFDAIKVSIPAILYLIQTSVLYVALANLSAPIFQVTYQFKLVTTALLSVLLLQRSYSVQQWVCLILLSIGVAIVVLGEQKTKSSSTDTSNVTAQNLVVGFVSVSVASFSSALAGVYFEVVLKKQAPASTAKTAATSTEKIKPNGNDENNDTTVSNDDETKSLISSSTNSLLSTASTNQISNTTTCTSNTAATGTSTLAAERPPPSLWMRNIQLSVFSIILAALVPYIKQIYFGITGSGGVEEIISQSTTTNKSYLHGFTMWVWVLVGLQAGGGLLVAAIMKYADNVLKGLATGVSIVFATFVSSLVFTESTQLSIQFCSGASLILCSVYYFSNPLPSSTILQRIITLARHRYMFLSTAFIPSSLSSNNNTEDERTE